jgi:hypothetical protein
MHAYLVGSDVVSAESKDSKDSSYAIIEPKVMQTADGRIVVFPIIAPVKAEASILAPGGPVWQIVFDLVTAVLAGFILYRVTMTPPFAADKQQ